MASAVGGYGGKLLNISRILLQSIRTKSTKKGAKKPKYLYKDLKENLYPDDHCIESNGMKYYPRDPNYKDPPYEPSKLLLVTRVKHLKGRPYWDREALKVLGFAQKRMGDSVIVKNIPERNRQIWKVKHLVEVQAVSFPSGEPTEEDVNRSFLKRNGEIIVSDLAVVNPDRIKARECFRNDPRRLTGWDLKSEARRRWELGGLN